MALLSTQAQAKYLTRAHRDTDDDKKKRKENQDQEDEKEKKKKEVVKKSFVSPKTSDFLLRCVSRTQIE